MLKETKVSLFYKSLLLLCSMLWGSSFFILKKTLEELPLYFFLALRFFLASLLLSIVFYKSWKKFNLAHLKKGVVTGLFLAFAYVLQSVGLKHTTPGMNSFLTTTYCIMVPFLFWIFRKEKPSLKVVLSAVICIIGIGVMAIAPGGTAFSFMGEGLTIFCGLFFAMQIVLISIWGKDLDIILFTIIQFLTTAVVMCLFSLATREPLPTSVSPLAITYGLYLTIFVTTIGFLLMNIGIKKTSPSSSSLILSLQSVFGFLFSGLFYKERLTIKTALGFTLIFIALVLAEIKFKKPVRTLDKKLPELKIEEPPKLLVE